MASARQVLQEPNSAAHLQRYHIGGPAARVQDSFPAQPWRIVEWPEPEIGPAAVWPAFEPAEFRARRLADLKA